MRGAGVPSCRLGEARLWCRGVNPAVYITYLALQNRLCTLAKPAGIGDIHALLILSARRRSLCAPLAASPAPDRRHDSPLTLKWLPAALVALSRCVRLG